MPMYWGFYFILIFLMLMMGMNLFGGLADTVYKKEGAGMEVYMKMEWFL